MGEKIKLVVSSLCIFQWVATLFGMAYSSTTPMVQDLDRSAEIMVLSCPQTARSDFNASHFNNGLLLHPRDPKGDFAGAGAAAAALNLKNLEVQASTGPQALMEDDGIIGTGEKARVPIISFATSKSLTLFQSSNFNRIAHDSSSLENTIGAIGQPFRWREMSKDLFWIRTDTIVNDLTSTSSSMLNSKRVVLGLRSCVPVYIEVKNFSDRWRRNFQHNPTIDNPHLNVFGKYGYNIAGSLAMAGELAEAGSFGYQKANSSQSLNLMESLVIRNALSNTTLEGFSRKSGLICGRLQSLTFEIVNIESKGRRDKGLWKHQNGLKKILNSIGKASTSTSWGDLGSIMWPGDSSSFPRGWCNRRKVRVGVPVKDGFGEFVIVTFDPVIKRKHVTSYRINIFMANLEELSSAEVSEFTSFGKPIKEMAATYNGSIDQVYAMNLVTVVGDTTVKGFTLPFRESDPTEDVCCSLGVNHWLVCINFFLFIGSVVWILVKLANDYFEPQTRLTRTSL